MVSQSRAILLAAGLFVAPLVPALAQQNYPAGNLGSNKSITAAPGTADSHAASGMNTGDSHGTVTRPYGTTAMNPYAPGATGQSVVRGTTSSQAGATSATTTEKTGTVTGGAK